MKILYIKPKRTKRMPVTDFSKVFETFLASGEEFVVWGNPTQKNAYVCQISSINYCKRCGKPVHAKVLYRDNKVYIVRKDSVETFYKIVGR